MAGFILGVDRGQGTLLPEYLEDLVDESNPVRVIDAFIEALNGGERAFEGAAPADTGRPGYHPAVMLKLYTYGYLNRVHSSRRLRPVAVTMMSASTCSPDAMRMPVSVKRSMRP